MGDDFRLGWRPRPLSLGDWTLKLDPDIEAQIRVLSMRMTPAAPALRPIVLTPQWSLLSPSYLDRLLASPPPAGRTAPAVPRGAGPSTPRAADASDVLRALWAVPSVQHAAMGVLDRVERDFSGGWTRATPAEKGLVIGWGVVTAATLAPLLANADTRMGILTFLEGKDIPVPGVSGLSLRVGPRGGGATWNNFLVPGLSIGGGAQDGAGGMQWNARIGLDVAEVLRRR